MIWRATRQLAPVSSVWPRAYRAISTATTGVIHNIKAVGLTTRASSGTYVLFITNGICPIVVPVCSIRFVSLLSMSDANKERPRMASST